ncbi:YfhO family protein [Schleiferilactobacillus shenzhenensis]|uniref:YfhO n=1 Tax=Schleiferilactobacillus shenzhenensis LY-73 TaxID=1231336 RepID=U4TRP4_9LACO|nr:YfhO family protein [Schleiferilactobacillus shenzhenensis]ERL64172.1 hypothetical protein L248_1538 [Schleiferilactobacillus shenzhenensis LY-73]
MRPKQAWWPLAASFLIPFFFIVIYFALRHVWPFGGQTVLTVDLDQQYVHFFQFFKNTVSIHPGSFFYSFSKGLGGETFGTFTYYLMSPLNFLLFLFPGASIALGTWLIIALKLGFAGLFMDLYLRQQDQPLSGPVQTALAVGYGMCAYLIVNYFNIMWLDAVALLPLLLLTLRWQHAGRRLWAYPLLLAATMIINYYIGYMIAIFLVLYWVWSESQYRWTWRSLLKQGIRFAWTSILAGGLSALILLPTWHALNDSKNTYISTSLPSTFEYNPIKILAKLVPGAFSQQQMINGQPNIYTGMLVLIGVLLYFVNRKIGLKEKVVAGLVTVFLLLSTFFEPLDLFWHGMQFPIWYPYRFSFVISLWGILLTARVWPRLPVLSWRRHWWLVIPGVLVIAGAVWRMPQVHFLSWGAVAATAILTFAMTQLIMKRTASRWWGWALVLLVGAEMSLNGVLTLQHIELSAYKPFAQYTAELLKATKHVKKINTQPFYRTATTFGSWNDAMTADYFGGSHFNSMLEPREAYFYNRVGMSGDEGQVSYTNGTVITDALLDMRYMLQERGPVAAAHDSDNGWEDSDLSANSYRPDAAYYQALKPVDGIAVYRNPYTLPLMYSASPDALKTILMPGYPLSWQETIMNNLAGTKTWETMFSPLTDVRKTTTHVTNNGDDTITYRRDPHEKTATVAYYFHAATSGPYYAILDDPPIDDATMRVNGKKVVQTGRFNSPLAFNVAANAKGQDITFSFTFKKKKLKLNQVNFYRLDMAKFEKMDHQLQAQGGKVTQLEQNSVTAEVTTTKAAPTVMTSIPDSPGWHVTVDGRPQKTRDFIDTFVAFTPKTTGKHTVQFTYVTPGWRTGVLISAAALVILMGVVLVEYRGDILRKLTRSR